MRTARLLVLCPLGLLDWLVLPKLELGKRWQSRRRVREPLLLAGQLFSKATKLHILNLSYSTTYSCHC